MTVLKPMMDFSEVGLEVWIYLYHKYEATRGCQRASHNSVNMRKFAHFCPHPSPQ